MRHDIFPARRRYCLGGACVAPGPAPPGVSVTLRCGYGSAEPSRAHCRRSPQRPHAIPIAQYRPERNLLPYQVSTQKVARTCSCQIKSMLGTVNSSDQKHAWDETSSIQTKHYLPTDNAINTLRAVQDQTTSFSRPLATRYYYCFVSMIRQHARG